MSEKSLKKRLIEKCRLLRTHVENRELATPEEIAEIWPKKERTAKTWDWVVAYGNVQSFNRRGEGGTRTQMHDEILMQVAADEPEKTFLGTEMVQVYPKGLEALMWFRAVDWYQAWLAGRWEAIVNLLDEAPDGPEALALKAAVPEPRKLAERAQAEIAHQLARMAQQACLPGPQLDHEALAAPLPALYADADPLQIVGVHLSFSTVNNGRLEALRYFTKAGKSGEGRVSWNVFYNTMSMKLKTPVTSLAKDVSLASLLASVQVGLPGVEGDPEEALSA